jgi:hypothetical protein
MSKLNKSPPFYALFSTKNSTSFSLQKTKNEKEKKKKEDEIDTRMFKSHTAKQAIVYIEILYLSKVEGKK